MEDYQKPSGFLAQFTFTFAIFMVIAALCAGCASQLETNPAHSATEQLLLSTAADRAMATADLSMFSGRTVYVDMAYFDSYDPKYAEGEVRDALSRAGALLVPDAKSADITVEPRSGALSIDNTTSFFGIPNISIPIPLAALPLTVPEVAFYKKEAQISYAKFALLAYSNKSYAHIYSSGPLDGKSYNNYHEIFFVSWWNTNIPEKAKKKKEQKYEVWAPQYDSQNMPANTPPAASKH